MKRIVITGANKGIGLAMVSRVLGDDPEAFVFLGSRNRERGEAALAGILQKHPQWQDRVELLVLDVTSDHSCEEAAREISTRCGASPAPLYGVVNNAGVGLGDQDIAATAEVNTLGIWRVCDALIPLLEPRGGRVVNITSAAGPVFVAGCSPERQETLTNPQVTRGEIRAFIGECVAVAHGAGDFAVRGLGSGSAYGITKACGNAATLELARAYPQLVINACTPGYIETDMTRPRAVASGSSPAEMGMKPPFEGTHSPAFLLFGEPQGSGHYYGSDALRSPLDCYRSPGDPAYQGD